MNVNKTTTKSKKKTISSLTADAEFLAKHNATNLRQLQESNLLNLQIDELLFEEKSSQNKANAQASSYAESIVRILVHEMPKITLQTLQAAFREAPWIHPTNNNNEALAQNLFDKSMPSFQLLQTAAIPTSYSERDCFSNEIPSSSKSSLPIFTRTLTVPDEIFHPNDIKNHRIFLKMNSIVWVVAKYLQHNHGQVVEYQTKQMSTSQPRIISLLLTPLTWNSSNNKKPKTVRREKSKHDENGAATTAIPRFQKIKFRLRLNIQLQSLNWVSAPRLFPNRCNLGGQNDASGKTSSSSLRYNYDVSYLARHTEFDQVRAHRPSSNGLPTHMERAVRLCLTWCYQRGLLHCHDGIGGAYDDDDFSIAHVILYLYRTKSITNAMAPLQILAAFWGFFLATPEAPKAQVVKLLPGSNAPTEAQTVVGCHLANLYAKMTRESPITDHDPPTLVALYEKSLDCATMPIVLLDPTMRHNYLGNVSKNYLDCLREHCRFSREKLYHRRASEDNLFQSLFLTESRFFNVYDAFLRIPLDDIDWENKKSIWGLYFSKVSADLGDDVECLSRALIEILGNALTDRVHSMRVCSSGNGISFYKGATSVDEIPHLSIMERQMPNNKIHGRMSPTGSKDLILGISINPDTCFRVVDRCDFPPENGKRMSADDFVRLWGSRAELRRFRDGAIVHAVVWEKNESVSSDGYHHYENDDTWNGGIVERITQHILATHFLKAKTCVPSFAMRNIQSTVDGVIAAPAQSSLSSSRKLLTDPMKAFRTVMKVFEDFGEFLCKNTAKTIPVTDSEFKSVLGLPLTIDAVEPISPSLRYASLFPPLPHPLLCESDFYQGQTKVSGVIMSPPIEVQIRFGASSKWPNELAAIRAAKAAMLLQLVKGIGALKKSGRGSANEDFRGPMVVTPMYADVCFRGFAFRLFVRNDPEIRLLRSLRFPSTESTELLEKLTRETVVSPMHHNFMHAIYTRHPSSSAVVRLAQRWLASHLLSGHIESEAVELLVAHVYTCNSVQWQAPGTILAGFMRLLRFISEFRWKKEPLLIDPGNWSEFDVTAVQKGFEQIRGDKHQHGPALYIVAPHFCSHFLDDENLLDDKRQDASTKSKSWSPVFTERSPELVVLTRVVALAERTYNFLLESMCCSDSPNDAWINVFQENNESFLSFSALMRMDPAFLVNKDASSTSQATNLTVSFNKTSTSFESTYTRSLRMLLKGPKEMQQKLYRNLNAPEVTNNVLLEWQPIASAVELMKSRLNESAIFFYNELYPEVLAIVWRPPLFEPRSFSALNSEYMQPVSKKWARDTMVNVNINDLIAEIAYLASELVTDVKVLDFGSVSSPSKKRKSEALSVGPGSKQHN
jgi:U3 small nucleolar RNA-associated protein 22